ncbi:MAG: cysteine desulfurase family protein [Pseudanabaenaceae cyanobacterium]
MNRPVYLDNHATTPVDQRVLTAMLPYFTEYFGNPASAGHAYGWEAESAVNAARESLARAINCSPEEIIFTSGATEANNLAIKGVAQAYQHKGKHIITVLTEHSAVLDPCNYLSQFGFEITYLPVDHFGLVDPELLEASIRTDTILVSVMWANNEIGVFQPLREIAEICDRTNVILHTDAAQAIGKVPIDVQGIPVGLMSLTAHKIYGPKGIGALYVRRKPRINLVPQLHGGGQERGLRAGTLYPAQIVGFAKAVELGLAERATEGARILGMRERLWTKLQKLGKVHLNGHPTQRLAGNLNVSIEGVNGNALHSGLRTIAAVSAGSACSSGRPSHVLRALGRSEELARASLRFGIGRFNTGEEMETVGDRICNLITDLRSAKYSGLASIQI